MGVQMKEILVELYGDPELMGRFQADPKAVLKEKGVEVPEGVTLKVVADTEKVKHIVLPHLGTEKITSIEEFEGRFSKSFLMGLPA